MDTRCLTLEPATAPGPPRYSTTSLSLFWNDIEERVVSRDEVQEMRKTRDPITGFRDRIIGAELAETSEIKAIELEVKQSVDADVKKAKVRIASVSQLTWQLG